MLSVLQKGKTPHPGRILRGQSIDAAFKLSLEAKTFKGEVHSVFSRAINIETETGELFTLAAFGIDNAPNTVITDITTFEAIGITTGDSVSSSTVGLRIGPNVLLDWKSAQIWRPSLPIYVRVGGTLQAQLDLAEAHLRRSEPQSYFSTQNTAENGFAGNIGAALRLRSDALMDALAHNRLDSARRHAESLIGLGPGLTPAGDDFLVGLFAILNMQGSPCTGWLTGGKDVLGHAAEATNRISLAALTAAANGNVRQSISHLIEVLTGGSPAAPGDALDRVSEIGSTSGSDIIAGLFAGLSLIQRLDDTPKAFTRG